MASFATLWALAAPFALGLLGLPLLGVRFGTDRMAEVGWAWALGCLVLALGVFVALHVGVPIDALWAVPIVLGVPLAWFSARVDRLARARLEDRASGAGRPTSGGRAYAVWALIVVGACAGRMLAAGVSPVSAGDEALLWALKAKVIYLAGGFTDEFDGAMADAGVLHPDYPLFVPLLQVWMFAQHGEIVHYANRLPMQGFSVALFLIAASALRRGGRPLLAGVLLVVLSGLPRLVIQVQKAQADMLVAAGLVIALDGWLRHRDGERHGAPLAALGLAVMVWAKNEGLMYLAGATIALGIDALARARRNRDRAHASVAPVLRASRWLVPAFAVAALTWAFNARHDYANDLMTEKGAGGEPFFLAAIDHFAERVGPVTSYFWSRIVADPEQTHGLFAVFFLAVALFPLRALGSSLRVPTLTILAAFAGYYLVYVGTPQPLEWHLETSARRVSLQLLPAVAIWIAVFSSADPRRRALRSPNG